MEGFEFSRRGLSPGERALHRVLEALPGFTSWSMLLGLAALAFFRPVAAAVVIIAFDLYWLMRIFYTTIFLVLAYFRLSLERRTDWMARVREIDGSASAPSSSDFKARLSERMHRSLMKKLASSGVRPPCSEDVRHLVIFPVAKERREIFEPSVKSLLSGRYPANKILVVIALEERATIETRLDAEAVRDAYRAEFIDFLVIIHPKDVPGEARVKGANATHAARFAARWFDEHGVRHDDVVASCFDADTVVDPDYFGCLTYHFLACPRRQRASFQPIPVYNNNLWDAPGFARVLEMGSSFFQLMEATNPDKLVTFSSHSMSFKALVECGYWPVDMISDDSAIFWKAYLKFDGDYTVVPMCVTVSMDVPASGTWWRTVVNVYKQKRRWAWGVENFPIVMRGFLKNPRISLYDKVRHGFKLFEGHVAWATCAFILTFVGWLPGLFATRHYATSVLFYSMPRITQVIFNLASLSLFTTMILSLFLLPDKKMKHPVLARAAFALEWLLVPAIATFLSAMPALDTQTRLLFGKTMEFWVTEKNRK